MRNNGKITFENFKHLVNIAIFTTNIRLPSCLEKQDLYQIGCIVLLKVIKDYNKERGGFQSYAYYKIRYGMIDELRRITKIKRRREKKENEGINSRMLRIYDSRRMGEFRRDKMRGSSFYQCS